MTRIRAAFIALIIASVALAAYGDRISGNGPEFMPRDPGAARKNLSNVDAATGRSALGLGTMATEASTDYVATGTFTGHTGDKANPHEVTYTQVGALASSAKAVDSDKLDGLDSTDYVATDTFTAHTGDSSDPHGETLTQTSILSKGCTISNTANNVWSSSLIFKKERAGAKANSGDEIGQVRGQLFNGTSYGQAAKVMFYAGAGTISTSSHPGTLAFLTTPDGTTSCLERMRICQSGNLLINTTTDDGTNKLQVNGSVAISSFIQLASPTAIPTAAAGRIYFNGSESKFKKCTDGSNWVDM